MDVVPAGPVRRQWSPEAKSRIIAASFEPGTNIAEIARNHELLPQQLYAWRHDNMRAHRLPTAPLIADIIVKKYADHMPFYRQAQALQRQGIVIDRGTLCNWAGTSAAYLGRLTSRMKQDLLTSARLFADETTAKVLAPGTGKTRTGYLWAIARDDRAHGGSDPPAVVYSYMPGRGKVWAEKLLGTYTGIVQCDGYGAYRLRDILG